jgi:flagellar biosynthesis/type III secretory pathway M-ring protein FliF/YscJ
MENFWHMAAQQGFSVVLLAIAVIYFYRRQTDWEKKLEDAHTERIAMQEEEHKKFLDLQEKRRLDQIEMSNILNKRETELTVLLKSLEATMANNNHILEKVAKIIENNDKSKARA